MCNAACTSGEKENDLNSEKQIAPSCHSYVRGGEGKKKAVTQHLGESFVCLALAIFK